MEGRTACLGQHGTVAVPGLPTVQSARLECHVETQQLSGTGQPVLHRSPRTVLPLHGVLHAVARTFTMDVPSRRERRTFSRGSDRCWPTGGLPSRDTCDGRSDHRHAGLARVQQRFQYS